MINGLNGLRKELVKKKENNYMRKGEVPVGYIVAIVLGIAVIGLIGYWLFINYLKGSDTPAECLAYKAAACKGILLDEEKAKAACKDKWFSSFPPDAKECEKIIPAQ